MNKSRLSKAKQDRLMEHFVAGTTARCASDLMGINHKSATFFYHRLSMIIYLSTQDETPFEGEIEIDESYFEGHRKGKRGRGAGGKIPVVRPLKLGGRV